MALDLELIDKLSAAAKEGREVLVELRQLRGELRHLRTELDGLVRKGRVVLEDLGAAATGGAEALIAAEVERQLGASALTEAGNALKGCHLQWVDLLADASALLADMNTWADEHGLFRTPHPKAAHAKAERWNVTGFGRPSSATDPQ